MTENKYPRSLFAQLVILSNAIYLFTDRTSELYIYLNWSLAIIYTTIFTVILIKRTKKLRQFDYLSAFGIIATIAILILCLSFAK